ncbi:MAG: TatD family hydrolase [Bacteroidia bacterium]|nr:TatD family hydrolase [Bacteroidia bacterium]
MYINIHCHTQQPRHVFTLMQYESGYAYPFTQNYSIGLHPWHVNSQWQNAWEQYLPLLNNKHIWAVGECGLDALCKTPIEIQTEAFRVQIETACKLQLPLIIHCVKSFDKVLGILKDYPKVHAAFHGFNKNVSLAQQITKRGYYLSFGEALAHPRNQETLKHINLKQVLLETDYATIQIEKVYTLAAQTLAMQLDRLQEQIFDNCEHFFGKKLIL